MSRSYGETWVYESLVGGIPGLAVPRTLAVAIQFLLFEVGVLVLGWYVGPWNAWLAGFAPVPVRPLAGTQTPPLGVRILSTSTPAATLRPP